MYYDTVSRYIIHPFVKAVIEFSLTLHACVHTHNNCSTHSFDSTYPFDVNFSSTPLTTSPHFAGWTQVVKGLQRCTGPVHLLCARSQGSSVTEVQLTDNDNILSHECHAHAYKQSKMQAAAPSAECWQRIISEMAVANTADHEEASGFVDNSMDNLHELYEWIGATSCGVQGEASKDCVTFTPCYIPPVVHHDNSRFDWSWLLIIIPAACTVFYP